MIGTLRASLSTVLLGLTRPPGTGIHDSSDLEEFAVAWHVSLLFLSVFPLFMRLRYPLPRFSILRVYFCRLDLVWKKEGSRTTIRPDFRPSLSPALLSRWCWEGRPCFMRRNG